MKQSSLTFATFVVATIVAISPAQSQDLSGPKDGDGAFAPRPDSGEDVLEMGPLTPQDFADVGTIEKPKIMDTVEAKMKQIRLAKNINRADRASMESKYKSVELSFRTIWNVLEVNYEERIRLPADYSKDMARLKSDLDQLYATPVDHNNQEQYEKWCRQEVFLQRRMADLRADFPMRLRALNRIIKSQQDQLETWSKGPTPRSFISDVDRVLMRSPRIH